MSVVIGAAIALRGSALCADAERQIGGGFGFGSSWV